jgi:murein DD-endopeptidase MepM/ murein hydrolase activator NlpD
LQEARPNQQRTFKKLAGSTYDIYPAETNAGGTDGFTPNPIVWNKNSFSLVPGSGQLRAISYDGKQLRHLAIVKLQDKTTGQQFWVMNTHDPADVRDGDTAQQRVNNANLYVKVFNELSAEGVPVYLTGDFNNRYSLGGGNGPLGGLRENLTYCILTSNGKVWDAWDAAQSKSGPCPSTNAGPANNAVDHIFVTKDDRSTVSNFSVSPMGLQRNGSDSHDTIFVDIAIAAQDTTTESGGFAWPVNKSFYNGNRTDWLEGHGTGSGSWTNGINGIATDISSPPDGTSVYAMFGGTVTRGNLGSSSEPHGLIIETAIQNGTLRTAYAHGPRTSQATTYNTGDEIMKIGNLGNSSGGHLHIDMDFNGKGVCPQDVFLALAKGTLPNFSELTGKAAPGCGGRV